MNIIPETFFVTINLPKLRNEENLSSSSFFEEEDWVYFILSGSIALKVPTISMYPSCLSEEQRYRRSKRFKHFFQTSSLWLFFKCWHLASNDRIQLAPWEVLKEVNDNPFSTVQKYDPFFNKKELREVELEPQDKNIILIHPSQTWDIMFAPSPHLRLLTPYLTL